MLHANCTVVCVINRTYCRAKFYIAGIGILDLAPVTLTLTRWPSYTNLTCILWRYTACENVTFLRQGFRKCYRLTDIKTYIHTDALTQTWPKLYTTPLRGWLIKQKIKNTESLTLYFKINLYSFRLFSVYYIIIILDFKMGTTRLVVYHFREFTRTVLANFEGNSCQKNWKEIFLSLWIMETCLQIHNRLGCLTSIL